MKKNTLQIKWKNARIDTITHAYDVNGTIEFYKIDTGKWRANFYRHKKGIMVAEYWTKLLPKEQLEMKLHQILIKAREQLERKKLEK